MKPLILYSAVFCAISMSASVTAYELINHGGRHYVQTDRYTQVAAEIREDQLRPLEAIVTVSFSNNIVSVGDAVNELLEGSGYRWGISLDAGSDDIIKSLPLPLVVRDVGPVSLREALVTIVGPAWHMHINELKRVVSFSVIEQYQEHSVSQADESETQPSIPVLTAEQ